MQKKIAVLAGDGIGPEVTEATVQVLKAIGRSRHHSFDFRYADVGGMAVDKHDDPLPAETLSVCENSDAILFGAVGGPKWDQFPAEKRPEKGLLRLRKALNLFSNLRPIKVFPGLSEHSALKSEVVDNVDFLILRELTGGLYFGEPKGRYQDTDGEEAVDTLQYKRYEIERIIDEAFAIAAAHDGKVTSVDKANVLESSRLWREVAEETALRYPRVELEHMLVDRAAMEIVAQPDQFDIMVTGNMFGDILSDEGSMITGSLGLLPSASLSSAGPGLYEPVHGSAPDIAGQQKANPLATMMSAAMMLRHSLQMREEADLLEKAVFDVLKSGYRTADIADGAKQPLTTQQITDEILDELEAETATTGIMSVYS